MGQFGQAVNFAVNGVVDVRLRAAEDGRFATYQAQADRPFEHEERLKQLLARQSELNSQLDLDKGEQQGVDSAPDVGENLDTEKAAAGAAEVAKMAEAYMRAAGTAIREMPIIQRVPPHAGSVTGRAVAKDGPHLAVATAANRFVVVDSAAWGRSVEIGEHLSLIFSQGRAALNIDRERGR